MSYDYDDAGNLSARNQVGTSFSITNQFGSQVTSSGTIVPGGVNALTSSKEGPTPKSHYSYDAAGNQTAVFYQRAPTSASDPGDKQFTWTYFNLPRQVQDSILGTGLSMFSYDAKNQRVLETRGTRSLVTLGSLFSEDEQGAVNRVFGIVADGHLVAQLTRRTELNGFQHPLWAAYLHQDALGSPDAVTTGGAGNPALLERGKYDPFGERRNPDDVFALSPQTHPRNLGFTGHTPDDAFALTNMRGRLYDQRVGRFVSADPLVSIPQLGQSYNRYSYVINDPLHLTDPSGFELFGVLISIVATMTALEVAGLILAAAIVGAGLFAAAYAAIAPLFGVGGSLGATPSGSPDAGAGRVDDSSGAAGATATAGSGGSKVWAESGGPIHGGADLSASSRSEIENWFSTPMGKSDLAFLTAHQNEFPVFWTDRKLSSGNGETRPCGQIDDSCGRFDPLGFWYAEGFDIRLDPTRIARLGGGNAYQDFAAHEIGHAIGLIRESLGNPNRIPRSTGPLQKMMDLTNADSTARQRYSRFYRGALPITAGDRTHGDATGFVWGAPPLRYEPPQPDWWTTPYSPGP